MEANSLEFNVPQSVLFSKIPNASSHNLAIASNNHVIGHESQLPTHTRTTKLIHRLMVLLNQAETYRCWIIST